MRFLRRIAGFLGFVKDQQHPAEEDEDQFHNAYNQHHFPSNYQESGLPRKGFSVPVQVSFDCPQLGPLLVPSSSGNGGVQGLRWYAKRLKIDDDGDVADEFLEEVIQHIPEMSSSAVKQSKPLPRFQFKYNTQPVKIKNQLISKDGKIQQCVEHQGKLLWV